jgi:hypothetical protein
MRILAVAFLALIGAFLAARTATAGNGIDTSGVQNLPFSIQGNQIMNMTTSGLAVGATASNVQLTTNGNVIAGGNMSATGTVTATGNVTGANLVVSGASSTPINQAGAATVYDLATLPVCGEGQAISKTGPTTFSCITLPQATTTAATDPTTTTTDPTTSTGSTTGTSSTAGGGGACTPTMDTETVSNTVACSANQWGWPGTQAETGTETVDSCTGVATPPSTWTNIGSCTASPTERTLSIPAASWNSVVYSGMIAVGDTGSAYITAEESCQYDSAYDNAASIAGWPSCFLWACWGEGVPAGNGTYGSGNSSVMNVVCTP